MKRICCMSLLTVLLLASSWRAKAQADEIQQLALNIEKLLQFKQILSDMKKYYQIIEGGYNTVKNLSEGNFKLHQSFLDGLLQVSPAVRNYKKVGEIMRFQVLIVKEYRSAIISQRRSGLFNAGELDYMNSVYENLLQKSLRNLDDLAMVITAGTLRMSDDERLQAIDKIYDDMEDKVVFLQHFNSNASVLALQRAKEKKDINIIRSLEGIGK